MNFGEFSKDLHKKVGEEVIKSSISILITVGENAKDIAGKARELGMNNIYICDSNQEAIEILNENILKDDVILLKASNGMKFTQILEGVVNSNE